MIRPGSFLALAIPVLLLAACSPGSPTPMPVPSGSPSPSAFGAPTDQDWLVQGKNGYLEAWSPVCSWDDALTGVDPEAEFGYGAYLEREPGVPDAAGHTQIDNNGILLDFVTGKYQASRFDGDVTTAIGTKWETFGTFSYQRDAQGVITGGSGSGPTRILHEDGNVEHLTDAMTFTVSQYDDTTWCDLP